MEPAQAELMSGVRMSVGMSPYRIFLGSGNRVVKKGKVVPRMGVGYNGAEGKASKETAACSEVQAGLQSLGKFLLGWQQPFYPMAVSWLWASMVGGSVSMQSGSNAVFSSWAYFKACDSGFC